MFGDKILDYWDDIMHDITKMIAIDSVATEKELNYPYGKKAAKAVDFAIELMDKYSLSSKNVDYYACHAQIGDGEENAVVLAHLDVVPEGEGWSHDAFTLTKKDGYLYGRGIVDNKGPAIIALHCLRALKDVKGKRKLRVVLGSGEEVGMEDMDYYFSKEQAPTIGFTPDSSYGICNREKGIIDFHLSSDNNSSVIKSFKAGTVSNSVPNKAEAKIICSDIEREILRESAYKLEGDFVIYPTDDGAEILSKGIAAHASTPKQGRNAASYLVELLYSVFTDRVGEMLTFVHKNIGLSVDGSNFGINCEDIESGELSFNLGIIRVENSVADIDIDIRYPVTVSGDEIKRKIEDKCSGISLSGFSDRKPLYIEESHRLVSILSEAYYSVTNEKAEIFSMGGGTYAREMCGNGLSFGPAFDEDDTHIHDVDERIKEEDLKTHAKICLEAMYRLYTAE